MKRKLPVRPNLEHLKSQAKDLLDGFQRKETSALQRFRDSLPAAAGPSHDRIAKMELALHDAQSVIAREHGFSNWPELKAHIGRETPSPELLHALMGPLPWGVQEALLTAAAQEQPDVGTLPAELPVLPVRNAVLAVGAVAPLNLGRPSSLVAVAAAEAASKTLAVFSQKDATVEEPGVADLSSVGCVVHIVSTVRQEQAFWIVVRATRWIRLEGIVASDPFMRARVSAFDVQPDTTEEAKQLERRLREQVMPRIAKLPDSDRLLRLTERMTALELADLTIANLACSVHDKMVYASEGRLHARLERVLTLLARENQVA